MTDSDTIPFERTVCSCPACVACCRRQPGPLAAGDLERIAAHLGQPVRIAALKFWASPGALVVNRATGETFRIGTITPRVRAGRCMFLSPEDRCTIHVVAPFGCAYFDTHQSSDEAQQRGIYMARSQQDADYQSLRRTLVAATHYKPGSY